MLNTKIRVRHFHDGNDPDKKVRKSASYATQAYVVDLTTGDVLGEAWAFASPRDVCTRAKGREIATGRLQRKLGIGRFQMSEVGLVVSPAS